MLQGFSSVLWLRPILLLLGLLLPLLSPGSATLEGGIVQHHNLLGQSELTPLLLDNPSDDNAPLCAPLACEEVKAAYEQLQPPRPNSNAAAYESLLLLIVNAVENNDEPHIQANGSTTMAIDDAAAAMLHALDTDDSVGSPYVQSVLRTRRSVRMRDNDIVLATFPKSGTHFLASVVSQLLANSTGRYVLQDRTVDLPRALFHKYPIFVLLPDNRAIPVRQEAYDFAESVPAHVPRIFLVRRVGVL